MCLGLCVESFWILKLMVIFFSGQGMYWLVLIFSWFFSLFLESLVFILMVLVIIVELVMVIMVDFRLVFVLISICDNVWLIFFSLMMFFFMIVFGGSGLMVQVFILQWFLEWFNLRSFIEVELMLIFSKVFVFFFMSFSMINFLLVFNIYE